MKNPNHPLEDVFNLGTPDVDEDTQNVPSIKRQQAVAVPIDAYDTKDDEVDGQFQEIYDIALEAYDQQAQEAELVEGKYRARNHEIAAQYLNTALNAAANKGTLKANKDKMRMAAAKIEATRRDGPVSKDGMITGNRNDILKALRDAKAKAEEKPPIDM